MNTLRWWVTFGVAVVVGLSTLSFAGRYYQTLADWTHLDALAAARDKTVRFGRWILADGSAEDLRASASRALEDRADGVFLAVLDAQGQILPKLASPSFPTPPSDFAVPRDHLTNAAAWHDPFALRHTNAQGHRYAVAWFPLGHVRLKTTPPAFWSVAALLETDADRRLAGLRTSMLSRIIGLTLGTGVLTFLLVGLWTRALASAADSATELAQGDLGFRRLDLPRRDSELHRLVHAFNTLMDRLQGLHSAQQRFVADAAHELRTPLTILRGEIQVALRKERPPEKYRSVLQSNLEEVVRLSNLVEALLTLARIDARQLAIHAEPTPVVATCHDVLASLTPVAERKGVHLRVESPTLSHPTITLAIDPVLLHRIVFNLVDNAVRYSSHDDTVRIAVHADPGTVRIQVSDEGPGIDPEHLPRIFDRFYRVEGARNRASGGAGLGLAIVQALTENAGGRVAVASRVGEGTTFELHFPTPPAPHTPGAASRT